MKLTDFPDDFDFVPLTIEDFSLEEECFLPETTSRTVGSSFIMLKRRFLKKQTHLSMKKPMYGREKKNKWLLTLEP